MFKHPLIVAATAAIYLAAYCILVQFKRTEQYASYIFLASPFLIIWIIYDIIREDITKKNVQADDEPGQKDKSGNNEV